MDRKRFLNTLLLMSMAGAAHKLQALDNLTSSFGKSDRMPVLFLGHGSPMNAIEENDFVKGWRQAGKDLPRPNAILCISAHWETYGTFVTAMDTPRTIHDFGGFPRELYQVQYPAPGSPALAEETSKLITTAEVGLDEQWGLDHGCWSVVKHLYPEADIPVIQLSLDRGKDARYHYELARQLSALRKKGVLIVGSGNMVHNLRLVAWDRLNDDDYGYDWAQEASQAFKRNILEKNHADLIDYRSQGQAVKLAVPTPEHFLPLLYILALQESNESASLFNDKAVGGSLTMTSVKIG